MEIGADDGSIVGQYTSSFAFKGLIDEVGVYHRALSEAELSKLASADGRAAIDKTALVLRYSFDKGNAADESGNNNKGKAEGTVAAKGKFGQAMKFTGKAGSSVKGFAVRHSWTTDLPLFARAMLLAEGTLFIAGPPDVIDEPQAFSQIDTPQVRQQLIEQAASLDGKKGAFLWAVSASDGEKLAEYKLDGLPIFDGMAAADGRLYISLSDGRLVCMAEK